MVKNSWTHDYYNRDGVLSKQRDDSRCRITNAEASINSAENSPVSYRRRTPFIPFTLRNETGSDLTFTTFTTHTYGDAGVDYDDIDAQHQQRQQHQKEWLQVSHEDSMPFCFDDHRKVKVRHGDTHEHKMHQIGVCVSGWHPVGPITVDKVGTFFRMASPMSSAASSGGGGGSPSARVVVTVSLTGI